MEFDKKGEIIVLTENELKRIEGGSLLGFFAVVFVAAMVVSFLAACCKTS